MIQTDHIIEVLHDLCQSSLFRFLARPRVITAPSSQFRCLLFVLLSVVVQKAVCSEDAADSRKYNVTYAEIGGNGLSAFSLNIEAPIWQKRSSVSSQVRASIGISTADIAPGTIPLLLKLLLFGDEDWLELGFGASIVYRYASKEPFYEYSQSKIFPSAIVGYRYQSQNGGFVFRAGYIPIYDIGNRKIHSSFGLSIGFAF